MKKLIIFSMLSLCEMLSFGQTLDKKQWTDLYKEYATYRCLCEITDNKIEQYYLLNKKDLSFVVHTEFLGIYLEKSDSIGRKFAKSNKSIQVDNESDLFGMNTNFKDCLIFYKSKYLDSIAKKSYREFKKQK